MSRTDVHRPYRVMMADETIRHWFKDFHNHKRGVCDLQEFLDQETGSKNFLYMRYNCYRQLWSGAPKLCGCDICDGFTQMFKKQPRAEWNRIKEELLKSPAAAMNYELDWGPGRSPIHRREGSYAW